MAACRHALGNDVIVEMVGSLIRDTASPFASDMDLQVRRCRGRADVLFTETDKRKVARNLELIGVGPVTIGNVAIKFKLGDFPVDLVLMNPRWEDFPNLRGGENFYENSARIHECFNQMPVARSVILGVKHFFWDKRPKGILLEAIVWRLSTIVSGSLSTTMGDDDFSREALSFLFTMLCLHSRIVRGHGLKVIESKIWTNCQRGNGTNTFKASTGLRRCHIWIWNLGTGSLTYIQRRCMSGLQKMGLSNRTVKRLLGSSSLPYDS